ncbi:MAG: diguanylate cyclase, partial [Actinomycetota bacterium]
MDKPDLVAQLDETEERYRSIVETAVDGIVTIDENGTILSANPAVERMFGWTEAELRTRNVAVLMPEPYRSQHQDYVRRFLATGRSRVIGRGRDVVAMRRDGSTFPIHLSVGEMRVRGKRMFTGIIHDLTERRRVERELRRSEVRARMLAEQGALRRVATAVATESDPSAVFDLAAKEVAGLLRVEAGLVVRFDEECGVPVGWWGPGTRVDATFPLTGRGAAALVHETARPARVDDYDALEGEPVAAIARAAGFRCSVAAPILARGVPWGVVLASSLRSRAFADRAEDDLADFAELLGVAISNAADRARLLALALSDPLTGLANHRAFQERLAAEVARARGGDGAVSLVVIDIDRFKRINDTWGHQAGDRVILDVAQHLRNEARPGDLVARIGGEEFAWILPGADAAGAYEAAERVRRRIAETRFPEVERLTISAGVCALDDAADAPDLVRLADGALYWAKHRGRNMVCVYSRETEAPLSGEEHARRLERLQVLNGIRLLARAVDARDPSTQRHSERVAEIAVRVATALGWNAEQVASLHEAALIHDVGKIGVPDAILRKAGPLTDEEFAQVRQHAALGAGIVAGIVSVEQEDWIRHHHERIDGGGYPDGLRGPAISQGARILALADAWDVMTSERPYKLARPLEDALDECRRQAGFQFCPR